MSSTTTIRVSIETRDTLTTQARYRGLSVTSLVAELARQSELAEEFRRERELWLAESDDTESAAELTDWESASDDGLD